MSTDNPTNSPERKKITNKDVAKFAGVSVATVSYVMNGRTDQRISESTRKKVLQAANYLNYVPNTFAAGLRATPPAQTIAVRLPENASAINEMGAMFFFREFARVCEKNCFNLIYSAEKRPTRLTANACVCIGMSKTEFHAICDENFIPVIALDSIIDDPVFYQINIDLIKMRDAVLSEIGAFTYIAPKPENEELRRHIISEMPGTVFVSSVSDLIEAANGSARFAVSDEALIGLARDLALKNVFLYESYSEKRPLLVMDAVKKAISRESVSDESHFITA